MQLHCSGILEVALQKDLFCQPVVIRGTTTCWINSSVACADMEQCPPWKCFGLKMCVVVGA